MNNKELSEKLAKWAGFKPLTHQDVWPDISTNHPERIVKWRSPEGYDFFNLPEFTSSLDIDFQWLWGKSVDTHSKMFKCDKEYSINQLFGWWLRESVDKPFPLALCLAIEKLIDAESKS